MHVLENEYLKLVTTPEAGQMLSLKKDGVELLYQGDEGWSGRNPSLFPIVGNTASGSYEIDGKTYAMKNHGLVRYAVLHEQGNEGYVTYTLLSDEETRAQYPFDFKYVMGYRLDGKTVHISYLVENTGDKPMPFTFGLHPAFKLEEDFSSYSLEFLPEGDAVQVSVTDGTRKPAHLGSWKLDREEIRSAGTLVYEDLACSAVVLKHGDDPVLTVHFEDFPMVAIWTHPQDSHFLCIEPWYGHADFGPVDCAFEDREGMMVLEPGQKWSTDYRIEVA